VFDACGGSAACRDYTARVRRLVVSLRRNEELRADVLRGAVSPAALADAPTEALATAAQRDALRASQDAATRRATAGADDGGLPTKEHPCPLCGSADVTFVRVGGARDIGKSETWGSKDAEAFSLRLTCTECQVRATRGGARTCCPACGPA
jgi:transcription elongation factor S-II